MSSEKKIGHEDFRLKIGTTDKASPLVIYLEGRTFIAPLEEKDTYKKDITGLKIALKDIVRKHLHDNEYLDKRFILTFQVASNGLSLGKNSFLSFEIIFKQKGEVKKINTLKTLIADFVNTIAEEFKETIKDNNFSLSKTKHNIS